MTTCRFKRIQMLGYMTAGWGALFASVVSAQDVGAGRACFDKFSTMADSYDPKYIDMISDNALIEYDYDKGGKSTPKIFPATQYKQMFLNNLESLKQRHDSNSYTDVAVKNEGDAYRVTGTEHSNTSKMNARFSMLFALDKDQNCRLDELKLTLKDDSK